MKLGKFIVLDGPNCSGKTTLCNMLKDYFTKNRLPFFFTKEPTKSRIGKIAIEWEDTVNYPEVLACLVAADRYNHLSQEILPAIKEGNIVICDRYIPSSLVFQRIDGLDVEFILDINSRITIPDLTIILDVSPDLLLSRLEKRKKPSRFERLGKPGVKNEVDFYRKSLILLQDMGYKVNLIKNEGIIKDTFEEIKELIKQEIHLRL